MIISASTLKLWMACPLQAKFAKIDMLPQRQHAKASFGSCIHHALEIYNRTGNLEAAITDFRELWMYPERIGVTPDHWPRNMSFEGLKQRGVELLRAYHENFRWDTREILFTEHPFLVPLGRHQLRGVVDCGEIRTSGNGKTLLRIIDLKTNARAPSMAELALDVQFTTYLWSSMQPEFWVGNGPDYPGLPNGEFLFDLYKDLPRRGIWWHLWNPKEIDAGSRTEEDFMRLHRLIDEVEKAMEREVFVPRIGDACGLCSFQKECGLTIPTRAEMAAEEDAWI